MEPDSCTVSPFVVMHDCINPETPAVAKGVHARSLTGGLLDAGDEAGLVGEAEAFGEVDGLAEWEADRLADAVAFGSADGDGDGDPVGDDPGDAVGLGRPGCGLAWPAGRGPEAVVWRTPSDPGTTWFCPADLNGSRKVRASAITTQAAAAPRTTMSLRFPRGDRSRRGRSSPAGAAGGVIAPASPALAGPMFAGPKSGAPMFAIPGGPELGGPELGGPELGGPELDAWAPASWAVDPGWREWAEVRWPSGEPSGGGAKADGCGRAGSAGLSAATLFAAGRPTPGAPAT